MASHLTKFLYLCFLMYAVAADDIIIKEPNTTQLVRMCVSNDLYCVRNEFLKYGWCSGLPVRKQNPMDPYRIKEMITELPSINSTVIARNVSITGLENGRIIDYYVNTKSNTVVLSVNFKDVVINKTGTFYYHRPAEEDIVIVTKSTEYYPSVTTTTRSSGYRKFQVHNTNTRSRVDALPTYSFPGSQNVTNPEVKYLFSCIEKQLFGCVQELFSYRGKYFAEFFIQNVICNRKFNPSDKNN